MNRPVTADIHRFHRAARQAYQRARTTISPGDPLWLDLGGAAIRLEFAGSAMRPSIEPALAHLVCGPRADADLVVCAWDSASTGVRMPPPPWSGSDYIARGEIRGQAGEEGIDIAYHPGSGVLSLLHRDSREGMVWMHDAHNSPYWERAAPLRTLLGWWCSQGGRQLVHGAAVATPAGAVLLTGKGGSGKSSTALGALLAGMEYLGDDYVVCDLSAPEPRVLSLFNTAKLDADGLARFPSLRDKIDNADRPAGEKAVLYAHRHFPAQLVRSRELRALVIPRVSGRARSSLSPLRAALAYLALSPTTVFQLPGARESTLAYLRQLVERLPCYQLELGRDAAQTAALLRRLTGEDA